MKGTNGWHGSGNLSTRVSYGRTGAGDEACNFKVAVEKAHAPVVFVRINVYGGNVEVCKIRDLERGDYVVIEGELMNRKRVIGSESVTLVEVRCNKIIINPGRGERN